MKKISIFILGNLILINFIFSQAGVGINTTGTDADHSAILDVSSTNKGVLIPRMTTTERDNIAVTCSCTPAEGLLIFNTTTKCFESYVNGVWNTVSCPAVCSPASPTAGTHVPSETGIVWNWNTASGATGYKWSTTNVYGSATDMGTGVTKTETGLTCGTSYTRYVWTYNACGQSSSTVLTSATSGCPCNPLCDATTVVDVTSPTTGKIWMDRNLGAQRKATSSADAQAYGCLFQWGRGNDGHACRTSGLTSTQSSTDNPGHGNFITKGSVEYDWRNPQNNNLWQGESGVNNPCPSGYRVPTYNELIAESATWSPANAAGAFASPLKWAAGGLRDYGSGVLSGADTWGYYWSSDYILIAGYYWGSGIYFEAAQTSGYQSWKAHGYSVRCIKNSCTAPASPTTGTHVPSETGIVWNWNTVSGATGYKWSTTNDYGSATDMGTGVTKTETGLTCGTFYTRYVWAYNACGQSSSTVLTSATSGCPCGATTVVDVTSPTTGKIWMDRNLGAQRKATSSADAQAYGCLFQWGRGNDGHASRTGGVTSTQSSTDNPGHGNFITSYDGLYDWRNPQNNNLWQGLSGVNNPCPSGYRVPTYNELVAESATWSPANAAGAFASPLKWAAGGLRSYVDGGLSGADTWGYYWSSDYILMGSYYWGQGIYFEPAQTSGYYSFKAYGYSVRCIKN